MTEIQFTPPATSPPTPSSASPPAAPRRQPGHRGHPPHQETTFLRGSVWRQLAENVANSLRSGHRVNVTGILRTRKYTTNEGEERTVLEAQFDTVSPDLTFATVEVRKVDRVSGRVSSATPATEDPWTGEAATLTPEEYQARMQMLKGELGGQEVKSPF
jgi:single-strand DNA-binding protein